jgi:D-alanyl-D-alanine carboxypeptidase/D-alanyl-D-alanine-endopeptidase (penicillin-binding protein 4)
VRQHWRAVGRRGVVEGLAFFALVCALAPPSALAAGTRTDRLAHRLAAALAMPSLHAGGEGALAVDLASGRTIFSLNGARPLQPASNEKLPLTLTALERLGPEYRFHTDVLGTGRQAGAVWHGDLYLKGHGDPALHTSGLAQLADTLHRRGIRRISGRVLADESWFDTRRTAPGWKPSFYMNESPPLSALVVNRAAFNGQMSSDPAGAAAAIFTRVLQRHGIRVAHGSAWGTAPAHARLLARLASQPLAQTIRFMDHQSDNFTAEMLLKTLGAERAGHGTTAAGAEVIVHTLADAGVPLNGVRIADGSGLSRRDRLTPRAIAAILTHAWHNRRVRNPFWQALAVAGRSGTLADRLRSGPAYGGVHAKTGTTDAASALSGYVRDRFAFAVIQNGHPVVTWSAHAAQDRFATALAAS